MKTHLLRFIALNFLIFSQSISAQQSLLGFKNENTASQRVLEKNFDSNLDAQNLAVWMKKLSAHPHHVGSPYDKENAEYMAELFRSWGYETTIDIYHVLFPTPKVRLLEMTSPKQYKAILQEPTLKEDATSGQKSEQLPTYNAFSIDGDVTAELVFVNYGVPADYEELEKMGIDVKGKIVIAKYYGSWRGIKPKLAAEKGAIGCIIYSDPKDDGYYQGDVYPKGPFRRENGVQRGSVLDMPLYPGDPLTPGYGATKDAKRIDRNNAPTLTKIPVLPISYQDAKPLLEALEGAEVPDSWKGALPITYHIGPGPAKVHLKLAFNWDIKPIYNVIAKMKGSEYPDEWVLRGNHHDAWVNGAADPISGMVALMEEARSVSELAKTGWKPKRTLVYCAWDAEEPGLLGSTEWVEDHADELSKYAVAYINTDGNGRGYLSAGGSHSLEAMMDGVAEDVIDPQTKVSVKDRKKALEIRQNGAENYKGFRLYALGSGSDYTPFIQHLGIPALNLGYDGEDDGGEYHSIYDSYDLYTRFKDPGFDFGIALAQTAGRATLRLANADLLPFEFNRFAKTVSEYAEDLVQLPEKLRTKVNQENALIDAKVYDLTQDRFKQKYQPKRKATVPFVNFAPLQNAVAQLKKLSAQLQEKLNANLLNKNQLEEVNLLLKKSETFLTNADGLPRRPWFKHFIYAPGFYTGYGVKTLPGVREAIEQNDWNETAEQIDKLSGVINRYNQFLEKTINSISN
ncbi:MAG: folate hydrolase [Bacteroidetes bacterium HGW-Bacteroidetes-13]|nr:MAG: folate hydrolase [Bacteroidetes bacterium HGW-Bacteroidetes-13]